MFKVIMKVFLALGVVFFAVAAITTANRIAFLSKANSAAGEVVNLIEKTSGGSDVSYTPEVRFYTEAGETRVIRMNFSSNPPAFKVGSIVGVLYLDDDLDTAVIDSFFTLWFPQLFFFLLGLIFSVIAAANILRTRKGLILSKGYNIELTGRELKYVLFSKKICPYCHGGLKREKTVESAGNGVNSVRYHYICDQCKRNYQLNELAGDS